MESRRRLPESRSVQHGQGIGLANQLGLQPQVKFQTAVSFVLVNGFGHQKVGRIMVALGLYQAGVKVRQWRVHWLELARQNLEFLATPAFDEAATKQMVDDLALLTIPD